MISDEISWYLFSPLSSSKVEFVPGDLVELSYWANEGKKGQLGVVISTFDLKNGRAHKATVLWMNLGK